jgi:hypothetical protein
MSALLAGADLLLCGDTGSRTSARRSARRRLLLFGPVPPAQWEPLADRDRHAVLWHGVGRGDPHGDELDPALSKIDGGGAGGRGDPARSRLTRRWKDPSRRCRSGHCAFVVR